MEVEKCPGLKRIGGMNGREKAPRMEVTKAPPIEEE
jgi:hypothetical protein